MLLVGGFKHEWIFHFIYGMSSFPLTNSIIFQRARAQPPTRGWWFDPSLKRVRSPFCWSKHHRVWLNHHIIYIYICIYNMCIISCIYFLVNTPFYFFAWPKHDFWCKQASTTPPSFSRSRVLGLKCQDQISHSQVARVYWSSCWPRRLGMPGFFQKGEIMEGIIPKVTWIFGWVIFSNWWLA